MNYTQAGIVYFAASVLLQYRLFLSLAIYYKSYCNAAIETPQNGYAVRRYLIKAACVGILLLGITAAYVFDKHYLALTAGQALGIFLSTVEQDKKVAEYEKKARARYEKLAEKKKSRAKAAKGNGFILGLSFWVAWGSIFLLGVLSKFFV